ncbi:MAG: choice-of-anchor B family protein, partial [Anaerolineales bacterium]|nr:choice-of-anchor B family protein [Anaerolineales bacterium]
MRKAIKPIITSVTRPALVLLVPLIAIGAALALTAAIQAAPHPEAGPAGLSPTVSPTPTQHPAQGLGPAPCENGFAGPFPCDDVDFISFLSNMELGAGPGEEAANLWGWTDPLTGVEYVIFGATDLTAFVDISDPENPVVIGTLPTETIPSEKYRDMKVYQDHAFIVADQNSLHGMQVFDLTRLRDVITPTATFTATAVYTGFLDSHNVYINEDSGYAYVARTTTPLPAPCSGAIAMVNIQDPHNPTHAGCLDYGGLASDSICVIYHGPDPDYQGRELCLVASDDDIIVADVTDKSNPSLIDQLVYADISRAHNVWVTEDHRFFVSADMNDEVFHGFNTRIFIW